MSEETVTMLRHWAKHPYGPGPHYIKMSRDAVRDLLAAIPEQPTPLTRNGLEREGWDIPPEAA